MEIEKYYDEHGKQHTVKTCCNRGCFSLFVDGAFHCFCDSSSEKRETISELVDARNWSATRPKRQKNTPLVPASK